MEFAYLDSPIGPVLIAADEAGLRRVALGAAAAGPAPGWRRGARWTGPGREQLRAWFAGSLQRFELALAPVGSGFDRRVWTALREIPFGATASYGALARRIGRPGAARAVGAANGRNPLGIVVPCHRVIGADGSLTGYGGGLEAKAWLLAHEARVAVASRSRERGAAGGRGEIRGAHA